jgi:hypothetical protein
VGTEIKQPHSYNHRTELWTDIPSPVEKPVPGSRNGLGGIE